MHYNEYFLKKNIINQEIFNKKINWFFDIKSIFQNKIKRKDIRKYANQLVNDYQKIKIRSSSRKNKIIINTTPFIKNSSSKKIVIFLRYIERLNIKKYFKYFLIQGSFASKDYIYGWSDVDTWTVIKDEILKDATKLIKLRKILNKVYKKINVISKFQHHGITIYTEKDLLNYLHGFLPKQALIKNISLFREKEIILFQTNKKINLSYKILKDKFSFLQKSILIKKYNHHVRKKIPKIPFKKNDPYLFELFYHITTILNIPILFLDAINKSSHKKKSFLKFYNIINNDFVKNFIKKHEEIRLNWKKYGTKKFIIPSKLINDLGDNYLENCLKVYEIVIKKIKDTR